MRNSKQTKAAMLGTAVTLTALLMGGAAPARAQESGFVRWTEPKEKSFSLEVPRGWKIRGGLVRAGATDVRQSVVAESPDGNIGIAIGDTSLPTFATLGQFEQQRGIQEGTTSSVMGNFTEMHLHYMPASEFNRMYLEKGVSRAFDDFSVGDEKDFPDPARKMEAGMNRTAPHGTHWSVSAAATEFSGRDKKTGKRISGILVAETQIMSNGNPADSNTWTARPIVVAGVDDENKEARVKIAGAALQRMQSTWKLDPVWSSNENRRVARITQASIQRSQRQMRLAAAPTGGGRRIGGSAAGGSAGSMAAYWRNNARRAEQQHQFINHIRDEKDVIGTDGNTYVVPNN